jgi:hypothetical protein
LAWSASLLPPHAASDSANTATTQTIPTLRMRTSGNGDRVQAAFYRGQGRGNREQGTGDREQGTGNREEGTGNRGQGTGDREQGRGDRERPAGLLYDPAHAGRIERTGLQGQGR